MQQDFINSFKENARFRIDENTRMLCIALAKIKQKQEMFFFSRFIRQAI